MAKIAYFDCASGISGDMCLGAVVHAGAPLAAIRRTLKGLRVAGYRLEQRPALRSGLAATKVDVILTSGARQQAARGARWAEVDRIIRSSALSDGLRKKGLRIFRRLFEAEAVVHGRKYSTVHLHETGAVDCMVDIFGTLAGLELLGVDTVEASAVNVGGGSVATSHGTLPVPAPATLELLRGVPVFSSGVQHELATPTGAAIITSLASRFGPYPDFTPTAIGLGAGGRETTGGTPNILRLVVGEAARTRQDSTVTVIETNIDDMNPQVYDHLFGLLFGAGALDVWLTQTVMKKSRPGILLSVLCEPAARDALTGIILRETTTIGVRWRDAQRICMDRRVRTVRTRYGRVRVKVSSHGSAGTKFTPEYEDCKALAVAKGLPVLQVISAAARAAEDSITSAE